jgi:hypothetical protein
MKKWLVIIIAGLFFTLQANAQSESDSAIYNRGLDLLEKSKTTENYLTTAFYFDSLTKEYPNHWLAWYYTGLSYILASQNALDSKYRDDLLNKAQPNITKAFALKPNEPELHILQAFLFQVRLMVDPQGRAMNFAPKADASIKKAIAADPSNPRAYFLQGNNIYYTPPIFKGGPKNALPVFLKAREKFGEYVAGLSFMPVWGERENQAMIKACSEVKN